VPEQVRLMREGSDMVVRMSSGDQVRVAGQYAGSGIERIEFGNGAVWGLAEINNVPVEVVIQPIGIAMTLADHPLAV
jgi:hypothetical protein